MIFSAAFPGGFAPAVLHENPAHGLVLVVLTSLAGIFRRWWEVYVSRHGGGDGSQIPASHRAAARALVSCGTPERGGSLYKCAGVRPAALFRESAATLQDIGADPRRLGARLGFTGVLQTWTRQLLYHPHIHYIVAGGGIAENGDQRRWKALADPEYLLPHRVLADRFRTRLREALKAADFGLYLKIAPIVWNQQALKHWVCDVKAVGSGEPALGYLARYVGRGAIGSKRLRIEGEGDAAKVVFNYKESATGETKTCRLEPLEFLRRFLQHVPPRRFCLCHRMRGATDTCFA